MVRLQKALLKRPFIQQIQHTVAGGSGPNADLQIKSTNLVMSYDYLERQQISDKI